MQRGQITEALRAPSFAEAERRLADVDADAVERDAMGLGARIEDLTERAKLLYSDVLLAKQKLEAVGGDDAVARVEAKRRIIDHRRQLFRPDDPGRPRQGNPDRRIT
ncbi:hypothetical protein RHEC894_PA00080 (plasmid) [Rhizobium sp. CIAT894]|nr:hypothetical protein RHEC894_PA00080 [Rhizobium sp. CIAT894]